MSSTNKRKIDVENREFQERWEFDYLFILNKGKPQCLECLQTIAVCKEYNLKRHYQSMHEKKYHSCTGDMRITLVKKLKKQRNCQTNYFSQVTKSQEASVAASFEVCLEIAKAKKPFSDGELIKKCAIKMAQAFNDNEMAGKFQSVSLSHQTVSRRVDEISIHVTNKLETIINNCCYFSIALDESTDISDTSQMLIFIRTVNENYSYSEELLKLQSLYGTTKGEDIYKELKCSLAQYGGFDKCTAIVTDGARAMTGKNIGLAGLLQKEGINCRMLHCIVHQEALCGISLKLKDVMDKVCKITNLIRGGNRSLTHRKFKTFLDELQTEYGDLLLHSNIRWLSAGKCLVRFFKLRKEIHLFLSEVGIDEDLTANLGDKNFLCSLAFLTDITNYLNVLNKSLQGKDQNVCCLYKHVTGFRNKLKLLKLNLQTNNLFHFESCKEIYEEMKECNIEVNFDIFLPKLDILIEDFNKRFSQFDSLKPSINLFSDPFHIDISSVDPKYQMELCDLQADPFIASSGATGIEVFKLLQIEKYPKMRDFGLQIISMFGSTYICERAFSDMKYIKSKYRNSLKDSTLENIIRLATTNIDIDIKEIVAQQLRPQCSH